MKARTEQHSGRRHRAPGASTASKASDVLGQAGEFRTVAKSVPSRWIWHYRTLLSLRSRLLLERGERLAAASQQLEPHSMNEADSATDEFDHDLALSGLSAAQDALFEVDEALRRILNRTYGVCEESGKPIPAARLRAVPWTRFSQIVEARIEQNGKVARAHIGRVGSTRGLVTGNLEPVEGEQEDQAPGAKDEELEHIFSPTGKHLHPPENAGSNARPALRSVVKSLGISEKAIDAVAVQELRELEHRERACRDDQPAPKVQE